jgi:hypothetical protein
MELAGFDLACDHCFQLLEKGKYVTNWSMKHDRMLRFCSLECQSAFKNKLYSLPFVFGRDSSIFRNGTDKQPIKLFPNQVTSASIESSD